MEPQLPSERSAAATFRRLWCCITVVALVAFSVSAVAEQGNRGNETDRLALLRIKEEIFDPRGVLSSWNSSHHFCQWYGVTCGRRHRRVTELNLQSGGLSGIISPHIGNLSFLRWIDLENNSFHMRIPVEVGRLSRLQVLYLNNNTLGGRIPPSMSNCSNLAKIDLGFNLLEGHLPADLGSLSKLNWLSVVHNKLDGVIPLSVGNLSYLEYFLMTYNKLGGRIPGTLGSLKNLKYLDLGSNNLVGNLPSSTTNVSSLRELDVGDNLLVGVVPWDLGITLPNLIFISLNYNQFAGSIPKSVSNISSLDFLMVAGNNFAGDIPSFGNLNLSWFDISRNKLGSGQANDLNFLCSLNHSGSFRILDISHNNFGGSVPKCIGNLSSALKMFIFGHNPLSGTLPSSIMNLISLEVLSIQGTNILGTIPLEIGNLNKMNELYLDSNEFTGQIPYTLGNLASMTVLNLRGNSLQGTIPSTLSNCRSLLLLDLAANKLSGAIPPDVMHLSSLSVYADFSKNNLEGELPMEIGNLKSLGILHLDGNKFSGEIPSTLGSCISLEHLYMQENLFRGPIPSSLSYLKGIQELNLSHNRLSGQIPEFLKDLPLASLDLAYNNFSGSLLTGGVFANTSATSVLGNEKLCGGLPEYGLPRCKSIGSTNGRVKNISIYTASGILVMVLMLSLLYVLWRRKQRKTIASSSSYNGLLKVSYQDLLKATNGFSSANLIGTGSFGSVFRAVLDSSPDTIAVKVLNLDRYGASKSFIAECEALRNIRHRNLVKVLTACSGSDYQGNEFKALVYEFMVNGCLDDWLHPQVGTNGGGEEKPRQLDLLQRVNIAEDVACALEYLHYQCETPIVHCDLKPSNVLIDGEMTGHLGDFGLVRFMPEATREIISDQISSIGVKGSLGYIAPEYGAGGEVSTNGDVYSYGILILEMFTGKRPIDDMFGDGLNFHSFAKSAFPEQILQIIDPVLLRKSQDEESNQGNRRTKRSHDRIIKIQECLVSIVEIGVVCSSESPRDRMSMGDVVAALQAIKKKLLISQ